MTFAKIFRIGLALPHFSCILYFFWKSSHHGEILDLLSKMLSKPRSYKCFVFGLSIHLTFSTVFSTVDPIFLHDDLISRKNTIIIHEKCGRVSPIRNILAKVLDIYVLLVKISKKHRKICKLFTVWFPKELAMFRFFRF